MNSKNYADYHMYRNLSMMFSLINGLLFGIFVSQMFLGTKPEIITIIGVLLIATACAWHIYSDLRIQALRKWANE